MPPAVRFVPVPGKPAISRPRSSVPLATFERSFSDRHAGERWLAERSNNITSARSHFVLSSITRSIQFYLFYLGPVLTMPFLVAILGEGRRKRGVRFLTFLLSVSFVGLLLPIYFGPSYVAALSCLIYGLLVAGIRGLRKLRWRGASGLALSRSVPVICFSMFLLRILAPLPGVPMPRTVPLTWCSPHLFENLSRGPVQTALESKPGFHLALVRYPNEGPEPVDWVQNLADIDRQKVVWANDLGVESNQKLLLYFKDRQVWLVEPNRIRRWFHPIHICLKAQHRCDLKRSSVKRATEECRVWRSGLSTQ